MLERDKGNSTPNPPVAAAPDTHSRVGLRAASTGYRPPQLSLVAALGFTPLPPSPPPAVPSFAHRTAAESGARLLTGLPHVQYRGLFTGWQHPLTYSVPQRQSASLRGPELLLGI